MNPLAPCAAVAALSLATAGHASLLLTEAVVTPTAGELVELYNPGGSDVVLDGYYLADYAAYHGLTTGSGSPGSSDFRVSFPAGATIAAGGVLTVSLDSAAGFAGVYGVAPDYDFDASDAGAPAMLGSFGSSSGLSNGDEMLVLFFWDGSSDLVSDVDYLVYGNTSDAMDKSGVTAGASTYLADTVAASQDPASSHGSGSALHRLDLAEGTETQAGGNGLSGADETSENLSVTWGTGAPTPGGVVPEPGSAALLALGAGLAWRRRR